MGVVCPACALPVTAGQVHALGRVWHPKCFVCKKCGKELRHEQFVLLDNKPYCDLCVHRNPDLVKKSRLDSGKTTSGKPAWGKSNSSTTTTTTTTITTTTTTTPTPYNRSASSSSNTNLSATGSSGDKAGQRGPDGQPGYQYSRDNEHYGPYGGWKKGDNCVLQ